MLRNFEGISIRYLQWFVNGTFAVLSMCYDRWQNRIGYEKVQESNEVFMESKFLTLITFS